MEGGGGRAISQLLAVESSLNSVEPLLYLLEGNRLVVFSYSARCPGKGDFKVSLAFSLKRIF